MVYRAVAAPSGERCRCYGTLPAAAKLDDLSTVALGWTALWRRAEIHPCPTLLFHLEPQFAARLRFAVERLSHRGRAAYFTQKENLNLKIATLSSDLQ